MGSYNKQFIPTINEIFQDKKLRDKITPEEWNIILNQLAHQTNITSQQLKDLHDFLMGGESEGMISLPQNILDYIKNNSSPIHVGPTPPEYYDVGTVWFNTNVDGQVNHYTVTFVMNGGDVIPPQEVEEGEPIYLEEGPTREGYIFLGWFKDEELTQPFSLTHKITDNITLYASWQIQVYNVVFREYHTNNIITMQVVEHGDTPNQPSDPYKGGYEFVTWTTGHQVLGQWVSFNFDNPITSKTTVYAVFEPLQEYTITFSGAAIDPISYYDNTVVPEPDHPTLTGHDFDGWYLDPSYTMPLEFGIVMSGDFTIFVKWTPKTYTMYFWTYDAPDIAPIHAPYGGTFTAPEEPTLEGYDFGGWVTVPGGEVLYNFDTSVTQNITVYAKWTIKEYTVTFNSAGGTSVDSVNVSHGNHISAPTAPTKEGYNFQGWYIGETLYSFNTSVTEDITLVADWEIKTYYISFNTNGGNSITTITVEHGNTFTPPANPWRSGYSFEGWYASAQLFPETLVENMGSWEATHDQTFHAKWEEIIPVPATEWVVDNSAGVWTYTIDLGKVGECPTEEGALAILEDTHPADQEYQGTKARVVAETFDPINMKYVDCTQRRFRAD